MDEFNAEHGGIDVPFNHLALVSQTVGDERGCGGGHARTRRLQRRRRGTAERLARDLAYARRWARDWAPESMRIGLLDPQESREAAAGLDEEQREYLADISAKLGPEMDGDGVQDLLYSTAVGREHQAEAGVRRRLQGLAREDQRPEGRALRGGPAP